MMTETLLPQPDGMAPRCYSRTKRKTSVFWHIGCTKKVWG